LQKSRRTVKPEDKSAVCRGGLGAFVVIKDKKEKGKIKNKRRGYFGGYLRHCR
jgi:hypothetical protein